MGFWGGSRRITGGRRRVGGSSFSCGISTYQPCCAVGVLLLGSSLAGAAIPLWPVLDTPTFVHKSTDLVVVRCLDPDVLGGGKNDGLTLIEVEVLLTLKGN